MECEHIRIALSARLDGEEAPLSEAAVARHLAGCVACRDFQSGAHRMQRVTRLAPADAVPDLTASILATAGSPAVRRQGLRAGLAGVAVAQLAIAVPGLLLGADAGAPVHVAHEMGSWDVALAVGFLFAAWRPLRAWGMLPLVAALVGCLVVTAGVDVGEGHAVALTETHHLLEILGLALLWLLARPAPVRRRRLVAA